jgi:hypothetical protein
MYPYPFHNVWPVCLSGFDGNLLSVSTMVIVPVTDPTNNDKHNDKHNRNVTVMNDSDDDLPHFISLAILKRVKS